MLVMLQLECSSPCLLELKDLITDQWCCGIFKLQNFDNFNVQVSKSIENRNLFSDFHLIHFFPSFIPSLNVYNCDLFSPSTLRSPECVPDGIRSGPKYCRAPFADSSSKFVPEQNALPEPPLWSRKLSRNNWVPLPACVTCRSQSNCA